MNRRPTVVASLKRAEELARQLETGEVRFRVDLARRSGVSAMLITYWLSLVKLAPAIKEFVRALPAGTPERLVTERRLRLISGLDHDEQVRRAEREIAGFGAFLAQRGQS